LTATTERGRRRLSNDRAKMEADAGVVEESSSSSVDSGRRRGVRGGGCCSEMAGEWCLCSEAVARAEKNGRARLAQVAAGRFWTVGAARALHVEEEKGRGPVRAAAGGAHAQAAVGPAQENKF
jgi:hypothetical protein